MKNSEKMDSIDSNVSSSSSSAHFSQQSRHFYVAVDRIHFKLETLIGLLGLIQRCRPGLPIVVCCCSRDELDYVCSSVADLPYISPSHLYSDLSEKDRILVLEKFRQATNWWNRHMNTESSGTNEGQNIDLKPDMLVMTDACLPLVASGESPISARVLINFELPPKKEIYMRRIASCLAQDGTVINVVVGGEVVTLKSVEEGSGIAITEMPINISDML